MESELKLNRKGLIIRLARIQSDMDFIKEHIEDITLSDDDINSMAKAEKDLRQGKTRRL